MNLQDVALYFLIFTLLTMTSYALLFTDAEIGRILLAWLLGGLLLSSIGTEKQTKGEANETTKF